MFFPPPPAGLLSPARSHTLQASCASLLQALRAQLSELLRRTIAQSDGGEADGGGRAVATAGAADEARAAVVAAVVSLIKRGVAAAELDES